MKPTVSMITVSRGMSNAARADLASSVAKSLSAASAEPLREPVEERRLAGVRVADERDGEDGVARLALRLARPLDLLQLFLQPGDAVADDAAVELELRLADAARADAARLPLEVRPRARQARQHVLELRQLHLRARLAAARAPAKMSRISPLRSITLTSVIFSRLRACAGERSSSKTISFAPSSAAERLDLLGLAAADVGGRIGPRPLGEDASSTTVPPAVSISFSSSARCSSATLRVRSGRMRATAMTFSGTLR